MDGILHEERRTDCDNLTRPGGKGCGRWDGAPLDGVALHRDYDILVPLAHTDYGKWDDAR